METITVGHSNYTKDNSKVWMYIIAINPNENLQVAQIHYDMVYYPVFLSNPKIENLFPFIAENYNVKIIDKGMTGEHKHFAIDITAKSKAIPPFPYNYFMAIGKLTFDRVSGGVSFGVNNEPESFVTTFVKANIR